MYVCICHAVTDSQIREAVAAGHDSLKSLRTHLGVASECGRCARCASDLVKSCKGCGKCRNSTAGRDSDTHPVTGAPRSAAPSPAFA